MVCNILVQFHRSSIFVKILNILDGNHHIHYLNNLNKNGRKHSKYDLVKDVYLQIKIYCHDEVARGLILRASGNDVKTDRALCLSQGTVKWDTDPK